MNMRLEALKNGVELPEIAKKLPKVAVASAISGLIVAALILMTPNPWFEAFIVKTGLPSLISAAEPPLGARARIVFALVAALIVTTVAWIGLNIFMRSRFAQPFNDPVSVYDLDDEPVMASRRRRSDAHPDHPPRAPIMAGEDLGTPLDLVDVVAEEEESFEEAAEPQDNWAEADAWVPEPEAEPVAESMQFEIEKSEQESVESASPDVWQADEVDDVEPAMPVPEPVSEEMTPPFVQDEEQPHQPELEQDAFAAESEAPEPTVPAVEPQLAEADAEDQDEPIFTIPLRSRSEAPAEPAEERAEPAQPETVSELPVEPAHQTPAKTGELEELIDRLEAGLDRRRARFEKEQAATPSEGEQSMDSALREALDALHKVTAKRA